MDYTPKFNPEALRNLRTASDCTQGEFAEKVGISQIHLASLENGEIEPTADQLQIIAQVLHVPIEDIIV